MTALRRLMGVGGGPSFERAAGFAFLGKAWYGGFMGEQLEYVEIAKLEPWDLVVIGCERMLTSQEIVEQTYYLRKVDVPGLKPWMLCVPRRWYN